MRRILSLAQRAQAQRSGYQGTIAASPGLRCSRLDCEAAEYGREDGCDVLHGLPGPANYASRTTTPCRSMRWTFTASLAQAPLQRSESIGIATIWKFLHDARQKASPAIGASSRTGSAPSRTAPAVGRCGPHSRRPAARFSRASPGWRRFWSRAAVVRAGSHRVRDEHHLAQVQGTCPGDAGCSQRHVTDERRLAEGSTLELKMSA